MRALLPFFSLLLVSPPAWAQQAETVLHLCDAGRAPRDGQAVQARGTFFFDQHGTLFSDLERRCSVGIGAASKTSVWEELGRLQMTVHPNRVDATVRGRLVWIDEPWAMGLPKGYWMFEVSSISDIVVTSRTIDEALADLESFPKMIGVASPR